MKRFDSIVTALVSPLTGRTQSEIEGLLEIPPDSSRGDRAVPCFRFAKELKKSPADLAKAWCNKISSVSLPPEIVEVRAEGGYLNFVFEPRALADEVLRSIHKSAGRFGFAKHSPAPTLILEFSSPNIAKPFSIGHLRSTNIGAALSRVFEARGWRVVRINHLGDWGTQFGKLISAYRRWGCAELLKEKPILSLYKLYVRWHEEETSDPTLIEEARDWFARLERGDEEAKELWTWFRDITLRELKTFYKDLGVEFDHYWGESFYVHRIGGVLAELEAHNLVRQSDDATIIDLTSHGLPICVVKKSDDSSLYLTRDLAAAIYRRETFPFDRMSYVVGAPQKLHFQQLFKTLELMGYAWATDCEHIPFGHISFGDEGMSTRKGNVVFLSDVLAAAEDLARRIVEEKNPELDDRDRVAKDVALGAILFADLSAKRIKDVKFSWEDILSFDGETGPYVQYSLVRALSVLRRYGGEAGPVDVTPLDSVEERALVRHLALFPSVLEKAEREREPFVVAQFLVTLAKLFNRFYTEHRILDAPEAVSAARIFLVSGAAGVLEAGMKLLGIPRLERM